jgi:hypothetical protein
VEVNISPLGIVVYAKHINLEFHFQQRLHQRLALPVKAGSPSSRRLLQSRWMMPHLKAAVTASVQRMAKVIGVGRFQVDRRIRMIVY